MHPKNLKIFLVTKNGPGYNKNNKKFESAMLDIHDGMHSKTGIKLEKLDLKSQNKNSQNVFDTRYKTQKKKKKFDTCTWYLIQGFPVCN